MHQVGVSVWGGDPWGLIPSARGTIRPDSYPTVVGVAEEFPGRLIFTFPDSQPWPDWGFHCHIEADGYEPYDFDFSPALTGQSYDIAPVPNSGPITGFTRDQICGAQVTLSGLTIQTSQFGIQPWFELAYQCLNTAQDRKVVRQQKKAIGDTGQIIEFYTRQGQIYPSNSWLNNCFNTAGEFNQGLFRQYIDELLQDNIIPIVAYDGDNGMSPTDGYPNALRQLPIVTDLLKDFNQNILYMRLWDGVFYGSSPASIDNFGQQFRALLPQGQLGIEFNPGHIPAGNGPNDYNPGGLMTNYDSIYAEFYNSAHATPPPVTSAGWDEEHGRYIPLFASDISLWMQTWQIVARMVSNYRVPSNQPMNVVTTAVNGPQQGQLVQVSSDSNPAPFFMRANNPRGKYYFNAFEMMTYEWVRNNVSLEYLRDAGDYYRNLNCPLIGFPHS